MKPTISIITIPPEVLQVAKTLKEGGFETYLVGGCVRDLLLARKPKDWDITSNAIPEEIISLFPKTFYENTYGTVGIVNEEQGIDASYKIIEVTPYRLETGYSDYRRPDSVIFSKNIDDDLKRRDFTINALALEPFDYRLIDNYKGQEDIKDRIIRAVGIAGDRFKEDALRLLRALRLSVELKFTIETETEKALVDNSHLLAHISHERIRDEFIRIIMSAEPKRGIELAHKYHILQFISPELEQSIGIEQGGIHDYDVWEHLLRSLQHTADKKWPLEIRLAALFHDIGKPPTRRPGEKKWSFYGHEVVGAKMTRKILNNLKFPQKIIDTVVTLIRWHMFFSDTESITHSAVRRLIANVGKDNIESLMFVRMADRIGTGRPKESPYRLRKYQSMIEEVMRDPVSVGMLKIDGKKIMEILKEKPGRKIGLILHALLEEVLENPALNTEEYLETKTKELAQRSEQELMLQADKGKELKQVEEDRQLGDIRKKYFVE